jgi:4a-hydroxytetrahydrobiopterin dehydratase
VSTVLTTAEIGLALGKLRGWTAQGNSIVRTFQFGNFVEAINFVNKVAGVAEAANHHPDISINYNKVTLALVSHDAGGVTQRDMKVAAAIDKVAAR